MKNKYKGIYKLRKQGKTQEALAQIYGVTYQRIQQILKEFPKVKVCIQKYTKTKCFVCHKFFLSKKGQNIPKSCSKRCRLNFYTPEYKRERRLKQHKKYYNTKKGNKIIKKISKEQNIKFKEKVKARSILNTNVLSGNIKKPKKCSRCGKSKLRIVGHHQDYTKPLKVMWLCDLCHCALHKKIHDI